MNQQIATDFDPKPNDYVLWIDSSGAFAPIHCMVIRDAGPDEDGDPSFEVQNATIRRMARFKVKAKELFPPNPDFRPPRFR